MSGRKRLDQSHPDCAEYTAKFREIWEAYYALEEREKAKYPGWLGYDHPADDVLCPAYRECCRKMKALQEQYSYLFSEVEVADESEPYHDEEASRFFDAILEMRRRASSPERGRQGDGQSGT